MATGPIIDAVGLVSTSTMTGTGFVVDKTNGIIVTCRHVVAGAKTARFELSRLGWVTCTVEEAPPDKDDWAILTVKPETPLPAGTVELPLHKFRWNGCVIPFAAYGFATLYRIRGQSIAGFVSGVVRGKNAAIDLEADTLAGKTAADVEGLSGAPCLIGGVAVGIVRATLKGDAGQAVGATLRVIAADDLYAESGGKIPVADAVMLPYEELFFGNLEQVSRSELDAAADLMGVDDKMGDEAQLRRRVARAMIAGGLDATVTALVEMRSLDDRLAKEMAILAESLWVDEAAAESAAALATLSLPSGLAWSGSDEQAAIDLLRRACWHHKRKGRPLWHMSGNCIIVPHPTGEDFAGEVAAQIVAHFAQRKIVGDDKIRERLARTQLAPTVAVIFAQVPSAAVLAQLATRFPGLRVLFLDSPRAREVTEVTLVLPDVVSVREQAAREARETARTDLATFRHLIILEKDYRE